MPLSDRIPPNTDDQTFTAVWTTRDADGIVGALHRRLHASSTDAATKKAKKATPAGWRFAGLYLSDHRDRQPWL